MPPKQTGRPTYKPTDEQRRTVKAMTGYGIKQCDIAVAMDIDEKTLRKHYRREMDIGATMATSKVAESLYQNALAGNVAAQIFWMKARADWSEKTRIADADGNTLDTVIHLIDGKSRNLPNDA
ncbi:MAG: hypothetical protein ABUJ98_15890 [Hyphomicrobium sp.]